ncbi:hypothetical protein D3C76_1184910 [compost metagenome]
MVRVPRRRPDVSLAFDLKLQAHLETEELRLPRVFYGRRRHIELTVRRATAVTLEVGRRVILLAGMPDDVLHAVVPLECLRQIHRLSETSDGFAGAVRVYLDGVVDDSVCIRFRILEAREDDDLIELRVFRLSNQLHTVRPVNWFAEPVNDGDAVALIHPVLIWPLLIVMEVRQRLSIVQRRVVLKDVRDQHVVGRQFMGAVFLRQK